MRGSRDGGRRGSKSARRGRLPRAPPVLVVLCGPSHAGKSTFAARFCKGFTVVSSEQIRRRLTGSASWSPREEEIWKTFESEKRRALREGRGVVLDACHITKRARWHALQGPNERHRKVCVVFDLPLATILQRCARDRRLSLEEAERMWRAFQACKLTTAELKRERFDEVLWVREARAPANRVGSISRRPGVAGSRVRTASGS